MKVLLVLMTLCAAVFTYFGAAACWDEVPLMYVGAVFFGGVFTTLVAVDLVERGE